MSRAKFVTIPKACPPCRAPPHSHPAWLGLQLLLGLQPVPSALLLQLGLSSPSYLVIWTSNSREFQVQGISLGFHWGMWSL